MTASSPFWRDTAPLVLASASAARRALLEAAAIPLEIVRAEIDEAAIARTLIDRGETPRAIALSLAHAKADAVARIEPGRFVLAADQTLDHHGELTMKSADRSAARRQLAALRGGHHSLHSAAVLRRDDRVLWAGIASARLVMRGFSDAFLDIYLDSVGASACESVGCYQIEALGPHLFAAIEGDHATILGLPLIGVLQALRDAGLLLS